MHDYANAEKSCATCGRRMQWRRRWRNTWDTVRYCSGHCRENRPGRLDAALEQGILTLLDQRAGNVSICPSEVARQAGEAFGHDWRQLMERTRMAARRLVASRDIVITQGGRVVDPSTARGPIRLRRPSRQA